VLKRGCFFLSFFHYFSLFGQKPHVVVKKGENAEKKGAVFGTFLVILGLFWSFLSLFRPFSGLFIFPLFRVILYFPHDMGR